MTKKYLTLDDLYNFYVEKGKDCVFSASKSGGPIVVHEPAEFSMHDNAILGLLPVSLKACHILENRNKSFISEESMNNALPSFSNRPILGNIIQLDDGTYDFHSHDMIINDDGNVEYQERPIGVIPESCNAHLEYDDEMDKTYVVVNGYIYEDYGNKAAEILKEKESTKVSVELCINELSYNAKEKRLELNDFYFNGVTCLGSEPDGTPVEEGMIGSKLTLGDFSESKNSQFTKEIMARFEAAVEKFNTALSNIQIKNSSKEGGEQSVKLQELLDKYSVKEEDIPFDYTSLTDEELEEKFEETFGEEYRKKKQPKSKKCTVEVEEKTYNFESSLDETIYALEKLVNDSYSDQDNAYYSAKVYEKYVVMVDVWTGKAYKQSYKVRNGIYTLTGDRVEVYSRYLTKEEETALDEMRNKYSEMEIKLNSYVAAEEKAEKEKIMSSEDYDRIRDSKEFKEFSEDVSAEGNESKYSVEDVQKQCDDMLLKFVKENKNFAAEKPKAGFRINSGVRQQDEYKPYGNLFDGMK